MIKKILFSMLILFSILKANENDTIGYWRASGSGGLSIIGTMIISQDYIEWGTFLNTLYNERDKIQKKYPCKAKYTSILHKKNSYELILNSINCEDDGTYFENFKIKLMGGSEAIISSYNDEGNLDFEGRIYRCDKDGKFIDLYNLKKEVN